MEEEWSLNCIKVREEVANCACTGCYQSQVLDDRIFLLAAVLHNVDVGIGSRHDELIADVLNLDLQTRALRLVPLFAQRIIHHLADSLRIDSEWDVERRLTVEGLFLE